MPCHFPGSRRPRSEPRGLETKFTFFDAALCGKFNLKSRIPRLFCRKFLLDGRRALLYFTQPLQIELGTAVECIKAVLLLIDISQLRVTVPEHVRVVEQHIAQSFETLVELFHGARRIPIAPGAVYIVLRVGGPKDAAELRDKERLPTIGNGPGPVAWAVEEWLAFSQARMGLFEPHRIVVVIVTVEDVRFRHPVPVAGGKIGRAGQQEW